MSGLDKLQSKIDAVKAHHAEAEAPSGKRPDAMRMSIEIVAGVLIGSLIGYQLDHYFDTLPIFFIICFFLGVAAGALNLYKLATSTDENEQ